MRFQGACGRVLGVHSSVSVHGLFFLLLSVISAGLFEFANVVRIDNGTLSQQPRVRIPKRESFAAPRTIRRTAARRVFQSANGKPVVLAIGVPQAISGSDWGCALQITGLNTSWRRPRYVVGIDGLQALHLAMKCAAAILESAKQELCVVG